MATYYIRPWLSGQGNYPSDPQEGDICITETLDQAWRPVGEGDVVKTEVYSSGEWVEQGGGGSSDYTTANVTLSGNSAPLTFGNVVDEIGIVYMSQYPGSETLVAKIPLYDGKALMFLMDELSYTVTGDITYSADDCGFIVTGDGTITFE